MTQGEVPQVSRRAVVKRLKRIEGQIRGIQKMVEDGRECESIITQLAAVRSAMDSTGAIVLNNYMKLCFVQSEGTESTALSSLARVISIWGRVRVGDST